MKIKMLVAGISLCAGLVSEATVINIPSGNFQNINAVLTAPLIGTDDGSFGSWSGQFTDLVNVGGQIASSNAVASGWPTPNNGCPYELKITLPASAASTASIWQGLTNRLMPDSVYTLTVSLNQQSTLNLGSDFTLALYAIGSTNLASVGGNTLGGVLNNSTNFQTVTLVYKTDNTVPANAIGISLSGTGLANLGGALFVSDFQLAVNPVQVQLSSSITLPNPHSRGTITVSGQGGAPGAAYIIQASTNLGMTSSWAQAGSGQFDANGNFSLTFNIDPFVHYRFFRAVVP